jgi:predicted alpha/beta superfamily hydrolase
MRYLILLILFLSSSAFAEGKFHLFMKDLRGREVWAYLPHGYESSKERYPVLYTHDGQNLFDPERAYLGQTWHAEETLNTLIREKKIRPIVLIAIDNTSNRMNEYTPDFDSEEGSGGEADHYLTLVTNELMPKVNQYIRTNGVNGLMGSSLGGLVSLYASGRYPFTHIAALSPSIWWNHESIIALLKAPQRLYIDSGTVGGERPEDVLKLSKTLNMGARLKAVVSEGDNHSEKAWAKRLPQALIHLFGPSKN